MPMSGRKSPNLEYQMFERATFSPSYAKQSKPQAWRKIRLEDRENIKVLHEHPIKYFDGKFNEDEEDDGTWRCNGVEIFKEGCKSG